MTAIEKAFINCIRDNYVLIRVHKDRNKSLEIALIGEKKGKSSLSSELSKMSKSLHITIFTRDNPFTVEDGSRFDLLLGCRPCDAEKLILESATKYKKYFVIMPCACNFKKKIVKFIRKYPVITDMEAYSSQHNDLSYGKATWIILYNTIR